MNCETCLTKKSSGTFVYHIPGERHMYSLYILRSTWYILRTRRYQTSTEACMNSTFYKYIKAINRSSTGPSFKEGLCTGYLSTLFLGVLQHYQGEISFTRASSYKSYCCCTRCPNFTPPLHHGSAVLSVHMMIIQNRPVVPGSITHGSRRPAGSM